MSSRGAEKKIRRENKELVELRLKFVRLNQEYAKLYKEYKKAVDTLYEITKVKPKKSWYQKLVSGWR